MARYGRDFKDRVVARLLPPESAAIELVSREVGISVSTPERWRPGATAALADPQEAPPSREQTRRDRQLEREVHRKGKALAETAALLVLAKKLSAIFPAGADE